MIRGRTRLLPQAHRPVGRSAPTEKAAGQAILRVILDVSRLVFSVGRVAPTGIDRVEMRYARQFLGRPDATLVAEGPWGFAPLSLDRAARLLDALEETWAEGEPPYPALHRAFRVALRGWMGLAAGGGHRALTRAVRAGPGGRAVFLLVSHRGLERPARIAALRRAGAAFVPMIHDVIPLTHPEHARPAQVGKHAGRIATVAALADGVIVNSAATGAALRPLLVRHGARPPILPAPLGTPPVVRPVRAATLGPAPHAPTFVTLSTLEPRKNHALLLHLWRDLAGRLGPATPRLVLLGRRGWRHEDTLDVLARCPALDGIVEAPGPLSDARVGDLLAGARALLFPSFAEGFGLPLAEALAAGVPAIVSDLPALREVGGRVPDYLDPLDGAGWRQAVLDYAAHDSPRRAAQLARLARWSPPSWDDHFGAVEQLLHRTAAAPQRVTPPAVPAVPVAVHAAP